MTYTRPPEQKRNSYADEDFAQVLAEIEEMDEEIASIQATAAGKIGGVKTRKANRIKIGHPLDPETVNNTLGVLLKYQDDIEKIAGEEAARLVGEAKSAAATA